MLHQKCISLLKKYNVGFTCILNPDKRRQILSSIQNKAGPWTCRVRLDLIFVKDHPLQFMRLKLYCARTSYCETRSAKAIE